VSRLRRLLGRIPGVRAGWRAIYGAWRRLVDPPPRSGYDDRPDRQTRRLLRRLRFANRFSRRPIVDPASPVAVSTTTYGPRLRTVHLAIESVARGDLRPRRHVLYLDDPEAFRRLTPQLRRLQRRGLEIVEVPNGFKVHTKHWFYVTSTDRHEVPLATSEDDILFPPHWLAELVATLEKHPTALATPRAHKIAFEGDRVAPYASWEPVRDDRPSFRNFGTSVSGQIYPPAFLDEVREAGEAFLAVAPNNDDLWLHHLAALNGRRVVQTRPESQHFPFVPGTQSEGLYFTNVAGGGNDVQIAATYTAESLARIKADT
jgi:hypothetical protein